MTSGRDEVHAVEMRGIDKRFGNTQALSGVDFVASPGEVHGLIGHNGSGKSTLIKILSGRVSADSGSVHPAAPAGSAASTKLSFVHQNLAVLPELTVTENLMLAEFGVRRGIVPIAWRREHRLAGRLLRQHGLQIDPRAKLADLAPVDRALIAIIRALSPSVEAPEVRPEVLVLDEPTVFLPRTEVSRIFGLVRNMVDQGTCVVFVSHRLDEILDFTDRVTVLRDGRVVTTTDTADLDRESLVDLIVGHRAGAAVVSTAPAMEPGRKDHAYRIQVSNRNWRRDVDIQVRAGEIVGVTGLIGSGYEQLVTGPYGDRRAAQSSTTGSLTVAGRTYDMAGMTPWTARRLGLEYIPADRITGAVIGELTLAENLVMGDLGPYFRRGFLRFGNIREQVLDLLHGFAVTPADPELSVGGLSGGNQQKVVVARTMHRGPRLLLLHEPTQGVDVGSRRQISEHIRRAAADGAAVVCASADEDQLAELCDVVHVIGEPGIVASLSGAGLTAPALVRSVVGSAGEVVR